METNKHKTSCALCGEKLTAPIFFNGKIYGWSCIKKVNPTAKKSKTHFVVADRFITTEHENGNISIDAVYQGTNNKPVKFYDLIVLKKRAYTGERFLSYNAIQIVDHVAYIDLLKYKKGIF